MARWTFLCADLLTNVIVDELPLTNVQMTKVLNGSGQLRGSLNLGDAKVASRDAYNATTPARRAIYALRDDRPIWGGIIWARDYDSATSKLDLVAADFWSYFDHRVVIDTLTLPAAATYVAGFSKIFTATDQNAIARGLVTQAQTHTNGNIGIVVDGALSGILRDRTYDGFDIKYVGDALRDLAQIQNGPDIAFDVGGLDSNGRPVRIMRTGTPTLGQQGQPWRWDLGGNMLSYQWSAGGGVMATRTYAQGSGVDRGTMIAVAESTTRYGTGWPLLEADDIFEDVVVFATAQEHADSLLAGLSLPSVTVTLQVRGDASPVIGEYGVGDSGRALIPAGDLFLPAGLDLPVRIQNMDLTLSDEGQETVKLACMSTQEIA